MIQNEREYMWVKKQELATQWELIAAKRTPCGSVSTFMLAELEMGELESKLKKLQDSLRAYEQEHDAGRIGRWMPTYSGLRFWPEDPRSQDIDIRDIAHSLARINRFNGHTRCCYSVAQHAVLVSRILPTRLKPLGLNHDDGECYLGDVITPIKRLFREFYEAAELKVMQAVADKYDFRKELDDPEAVALVKRADTVLLMTEIRDLCPSQTYNGQVTEAPLKDTIRVWEPAVAEAVFIEEFWRLLNARKQVAA